MDRPEFIQWNVSVIPFTPSLCTFGYRLYMRTHQFFSQTYGVDANKGVWETYPSKSKYFIKRFIIREFSFLFIFELSVIGFIKQHACSEVLSLLVWHGFATVIKSRYKIKNTVINGDIIIKNLISLNEHDKNISLLMNMIRIYILWVCQLALLAQIQNSWKPGKIRKFSLD